MRIHIYLGRKLISHECYSSKRFSISNNFDFYRLIMRPSWCLICFQLFLQQWRLVWVIQCALLSLHMLAYTCVNIYIYIYICNTKTICVFLYLQLIINSFGVRTLTNDGEAACILLELLYMEPSDSYNCLESVCLIVVGSRIIYLHLYTYTYETRIQKTRNHQAKSYTLFSNW